ncbi:hypothetical protein EDB84DRAFT_1276099 [Lactarius hengduanensis]|nr:hypothetical protein EDB84DRAFT_1276099 [Lactarius hengduanensis]
MTHLLILLFSLVQYGRAQQTLFPAAIPLVVRLPYLSPWNFTADIENRWSRTSSHQSDSTSNDACSFLHSTFTAFQYLGIPVHVHVDNITITYSFLGGSPRVNGRVNLTNTVITPTQTKLTAQAGPMQFNLTFLNPIEPRDWVKQSIPFSYLSLTAETLDGAAHAVQVYSDVSGEWLSGDRDHEIRWNTTGLDGDSVICHTAKLQNPAVFNEIKTQAEWGTLYYAMKAGENLTWTAGPDDYSRGSFQVNGTLNNQMDQHFRAINSNYPIFGIARDLGTIQAMQDPIVWTIGFTMDPAIQYTDPSTDTL